MIILIKSSFYDNLTHSQNKKIRNIRANNGLNLGPSGGRVTDGFIEWQTFGHSTIHLSYAEELATVFAMFENGTSVLEGFEHTSVQDYRTENSLPTHNQPDIKDVAETNLAIQAQGTTVMKVEENLDNYTTVEDPPVDNNLRLTAIKEKEAESFEWLNAYLQEGFDYDINGTTYNIPAKEEDIARYSQVIQQYDRKGVPDTAPTYIRAYNYDLHQYDTISVTYGEFVTMVVDNLSLHFQTAHGQRSANMDIVNNFTDLEDIQNYKFRIL